MTDAGSQGQDLIDTVRQLERRLARLEAQLDLPPLAAEAADDAALAPDAPHATVITPASGAASAPDFEFVVGQNWLASVGIAVLACGVGLALLLPFPSLPPWLPSAAGGAIALALAALGFRWHRTFTLVAGYFRGAGMALLYFSVLRLFFFGAEHALAIEGISGRALLLTISVANMLAALHRRSAWLMALAVVTGCVTVLAIGTSWLMLVGTAVLLAAGAWAVVAWEWPWLQLLLIPAGYLTFGLWLIGRPWQGRTVALEGRPAAGICFALLYALVNAMASLRRPTRGEEDLATILAVLLNCGLGYALFTLATLGADRALFGPAHLAATVIYLGIGLAFWQSEASQIPTFFYAMTGYLALSVALARMIPVPDLFIWLSGQSLVVVATALWFRSKLIVVGNFFIFVAIVGAYVLLAQRETGISIGFGIVALLTARILHWQAERLDLRTEFMRNAYLASAFAVFPYALAHLVPRAWIPVSWVAMALAYYAMNFMVRSPKYRWMGHCTLLLTAFYMIVVGIFQLSPAYRIASFLVLGTVLLAVSLIFTMARARRRGAAPEEA